MNTSFAAFPRWRWMQSDDCWNDFSFQDVCITFEWYKLKQSKPDHNRICSGSIPSISDGDIHLWLQLLSSRSGICFDWLSQKSKLILTVKLRSTRNNFNNLLFFEHDPIQNGDLYIKVPKVEIDHFTSQPFSAKSTNIARFHQQISDPHYRIHVNLRVLYWEAIHIWLWSGRQGEFQSICHAVRCLWFRARLGPNRDGVHDHPKKIEKRNIVEFPTVFADFGNQVIFSIVFKRIETPHWSFKGLLEGDILSLSALFKRDPNC
jgi:hypothetical protein